MGTPANFRCHSDHAAGNALDLSADFTLLNIESWEWFDLITFCQGVWFLRR